MRLSALLTSPQHLAFFNRVFYIRLTADRIAVRHIGTPYHYEEAALLALNADQQIVAVGASAETAVQKLGNNAHLVQVFAHPRLLIAEPLVATRLFRYALYMAETPWIRTMSLPVLLGFARPIAIVHPLRSFENGLAAIEMQTLRESILKAGARRVYIWNGPELMEREILMGQFTHGEWYDAIPPWAERPTSV